MRSLRGKTAYVTGGSSGIGLAIARRLLGIGTRVAIIARNEERLAQAYQSLVPEAGEANVTSLSLDVSDRKASEKLLPDLVESFGGPDILVNCHGVTGVLYFSDTGHDDLMRLLDINVGGAWNTIQLLLPELRARNGTICNVASVAGFVGVIGYAAYSASKFGLIGLSEVLRNELKPDGVRVCVLCPPDTDTPMFRTENITKPYETKVVSGTLPVKSPEYVADAFVRGLKKKRFLIVPGFMGRLTLFVRGAVPRLLFWIVDRDLRKAKQKKALLDNEEESRV